MCLLVAAWQAHPRYRLVIAANRDEFHERPSAPLGVWSEQGAILGGRDLRAGGTWLAINRERRIGVVTNFRDMQRPAPGAPSRGDLIPAFLTRPDPAEDFLRSMAPKAPAYAGFSLLLADRESFWYASNRSEPFARPLAPGLHGLSNQFLDTPWPKLVRVRRRFEVWLREPARSQLGDLFALLDDREPAGPGEDLPRTGLPPERERALSPPFVVLPDYGTRCSSVLLLESSGGVHIIERRFSPAGEIEGETEFRLNADEWP